VRPWEGASGPKRSTQIWLNLYREMCEECFDVVVHLSLLTDQAGVSPVSHVLLKPVPDELGSHQPLRCLFAQVGKAMDSIENQLLPFGRNDGPGLARGDITQEHVASIAESYIFQLQPSTSRPEQLHIWVSGLIHCHAGIVEPQVDGPHNGPGQGVCGEIGLASNMLNVRWGILRYRRAVAAGGRTTAQPLWPWRTSAVHKRSEPPALQQGMEVGNGKVKSEELSVGSAVLPFVGVELVAEECKHLPGPAHPLHIHRANGIV